MSKNKQLKPTELKQMGFGLSLFGGFSFFFGIFSYDTSTKEEADISLMLVLFGIVFMIAGIGILYYLKKKESVYEETRLNQIFFELVKRNEGKITVMDFALSAQLDGRQAKEFMDKKAIEFSAILDVSEEGVIIYQFK